MSSRRGQWLIDGAERARQRLEALPTTSLGPAARVLLGIKDVPCPTCKGRGTITIDPRAERGATDVADTPDSAPDDAIGAFNGA